MRIRRFTAPEMRQAIRVVRDELGPDAVILSNRKTPGGVEVVAAIDYDDAWVEDSPVSTPSIEATGPLAPSPLDPSPLASALSSRGAAPATQPPPSQSAASATVSSLPAARAEGGRPSAPGAASTSGFDPARQATFAEALARGAARASEAGDAGVTTATREASNSTAAAPPAPRTTTRAAPNSAGPVPVGLERELRSLRGLLESQMSSLAWADFGRRDPLRAALVRRLMQLGLSRRVADPVAATVAERRDRAPANSFGSEEAWRAALGALARQVPIAQDDVLQTGGVVTLLGPTGVGKTTSVAKLAARFRAAHGPNSVALLTTDNYRVGGEAQLRTYGQLMGLPVAVCGNAPELHDAIVRYHDRRLILIDTAGMSQRDIRLVEQVNVIQAGLEGIPRPLRCYLVMSAATGYTTLEETASAFDEVELEGCLITKIDEATSLGAVLSVLIEHTLPAAYLCDGQRVPEDISEARAKQLVQRALQFASRRNDTSEESLEMLYGGVAAHG